MNRALIFGIALFLAIVGIAMVTVDTNVEAGHRCKCKKKHDCCAPVECCAPADCCAPAHCCPPAPPACCGCHGVAPAQEAAPAPAPAPAAAARAQFGFRTVSFQR